MSRVVEVSTEQVLLLRHRVLRVGLPLEAAHFPLDSESLHWAYLDNNGKVLSVATAHKEPHSLGRMAVDPWRLRGMATEEAFQGLGYGQEVLKRLLTDLKQKSADLLWCNARVAAIPFYERNGFLVESEVFEIPTAGFHKVMSICL
jgi:GNAT superfamily N-acetyltransferase